MSQSAEILDSGSAADMSPLNGKAAHDTPVRMKRMLSGASVVVGGTLVWQVSGFIFNAVGAHALGPERYGVLAASTALLGFASPFLAALQAVASREATSLTARNDLRRIRPMLQHYGFRVGTGSLALGGATAAVSGWVSGLFHLGSPWFVVIVGAIIPCYAVSHLLGGLLQGIERFARFALESVVEGLTKAICGILAMGLLWRSALSGMLAVGASCVAGLITYLVLTLPVLKRTTLSAIAGQSPLPPATQARSSHRRKPRKGVPGIVGYSMTALATYGLLAVMLSSDTLVAKHYLSSHLAGLYAGASLAGKIAYFATSSLFIIAFPVFSRQHDQGVGSGKWILAACAVVCTATGAIAAAFALEPAWVVIPLLGERYRAAEHYVPWMAAVFGLYALGFLVCTYLLARKQRGVIAVLSAAVVVQFAGFFSVHSTIAGMMTVLAVAFGVMLAGGMPLVLLGAQRGGAKPPRRRRTSRGFRRARKYSPDSRPDSARQATQLRAGLEIAGCEQIVTEVTRRVGSVPVLLAGSRAIGTARVDSDYDISVVLPLLRIPRAASRLADASQQLSEALGVHVSVNPVPRFRMRWPGGSLFVRKLQAEAVVLASPPGWSLRRQPLTSVTDFAASSALLSAVQSLLQAFDTSAMNGRSAPVRAGDALRKAALHVAQVKLLRSGCYASDLGRALARLRDSPASANGDAHGAELSAALVAGVTAADPVEGFICLRQCVLTQLAEIGDAPLSLPLAKSLVRNVQYAALAQLRGRKRWRIALRRSPVEAALAATQLALLRALDPYAAEGLDTALFRLAGEVCPVPLRPGSQQSWEDVRDLALTEWPDAHPLVGVLT